jgi:phage terminase large subunit
LGTPNGKNQFYHVLEHAKRDAQWFYASYKASETGLIPQDELTAARQVMSEDEYKQEFECSFEASVKGSIYGRELDEARAQQRITSVPYDPVLPVDTWWDLGMGDATAIIFTQTLKGGEIRVIDYYEHSGEGLPHYAKVLRDKGYVYGEHWAPHDIQVRELASGRSRKEAALSLGIKFRMVPRVGVEDGIHAARMLFPRIWFDADKTAHLLESLQHYRRVMNTRTQEFGDTPVHDWSSHGADAFRYLCTGLKPRKDAEQQQRADSVHEWGQMGWMGL